MTQEIELPDDATRPLAPKIEAATDRDRSHGRQLRLFHRFHLQELREVRLALQALLEGRTTAAEIAGEVASLAMIENHRQFGAICGHQCQLLTLHHTIEDQSFFPRLRDKSEGLRRVVDRLSAEHKVIHDLLTALQDAADAAAADPSPAALSEVRGSFERLERFVISHFGYEERELEEALGYYRVPL